MQRIPPELTRVARAMRSDPTEAEKRLWRWLRQVRPRFTRQLVIGHFIADFACRSVKLVIELDGGQHSAQAGAEESRTRYLEAQGWQVLRFWNHEVLENIEGVVATILDALSAASTHPRPLPFREGR